MNLMIYIDTAGTKKKIPMLSSAMRPNFHIHENICQSGSDFSSKKSKVAEAKVDDSSKKVAFSIYSILTCGKIGCTKKNIENLYKKSRFRPCHPEN